MNQLHFVLIPGLPKLAWLAAIERPALRASIYHGAAVEIGEGFFVEGCWTGEFAQGRLHESETMVGSGVVALPEALVFVPPSNTMDSLFFAERGNRVIVSNSLPFLLAHADERLRPDYPRYDALHDSIARGIDQYETDIPTSKGTVRRLMVRNLHVTATECNLCDKPLPPEFPNFEAYAVYLERTYASLVANIRDARRRHRLQIFSTQSRGYDTTAVNAIAAKRGLDKVFTCTTARDKGAFVDREKETGNDDGREIGKALGFECVPIDRLGYRKQALPEEILYYAGSYLPQDLNLVEINRHVDGVAVLLSGTFGEVWRGREYYDPHRMHVVSHELVRADLAQHGMGEVRLHVGLLPFPMPFVGARRRPEIFRIACSPEMQEWRAGASYEKPIARRIAEERGVPRALFGQTKYNTTVAFARPAVPHDEALRRKYLNFLRSTGIVAAWQLRLLPLIHRINESIYYRSPTRHRATYYFGRLVSKLRRRRFDPGILLGRAEGALFCFGVNETAEDYRSRMAGRGLEGR
jgi:hypothetical protein